MMVTILDDIKCYDDRQGTVIVGRGVVFYRLWSGKFSQVAFELSAHE